MATANKQKKKPRPQKQGPVQEIRLGRIRAAIWENETETTVRHNVTVSRLYKDESDHWRDSSSFGRDDLLIVAKVLDRAHSWIFANSGVSKSDDEKQDSQPAF